MENATKNKETDKGETVSKDEAKENTFDETKCDTIEGVEKSTKHMQIATENDSKEASLMETLLMNKKDNKQKEGTDNAAQIVTEKRTVVVDTCDETKGIETEEHENKQYYANTENKDIENKDKTVENKQLDQTKCVEKERKDMQNEMQNCKIKKTKMSMGKKQK